MPSDVEPLNLRCLALTGTFETSSLPPGCFGCVSGDFDGQGMSFSALQWNLGQGTLQPLLAQMNTAHNGVMANIFGQLHGKLAAVIKTSRTQQLAWSRSIQTSQHTIEERWRDCFRALGQTSEFQAVAMQHASSLFDDGLSMCRKLGLKSERGAALLFDIKVQNGGIALAALALLDDDFRAIRPGDPDVIEVARMRCVANRVADNSPMRWREDVRARKMTVVNGTGTVHGVHYDLAAQFGLTMAPWTPAIAG